MENGGECMSDVKVIYTVTTIRLEEKMAQNGKKYIDTDSRCVGWFETLEKAVEIVKGNYGDIEEAGYYKWAIIEKIKPGLYSSGGKKNEVWFKFVRRNTNIKAHSSSNITARKIKCPADYKNIVSWSIG